MSRQIFEPKSAKLLRDVSHRRIPEVGVCFEEFKKLGQPFALGLRVGLFIHARIVPRKKQTDKTRELHNHMLGQFSTELLTLYPGANILAAGKEDFESQNRKKLFSRIATGNWDAVIVTHSGFERIPLSRETQERFFKEQLHELEMIRREHADSSNRRAVLG